MDALAGPLAALQRHGLLLLHDEELPSVSALVAGEPVRGSWWGHRAGSLIFNVAGALEEHPDALVTKLVRGKVTYVHRRLVGALIAVARERAPWQLEALPEEALTLLARVDASGPLFASGPMAKLLERRLLVHARQVHTEKGHHATELVPWSEVARERAIPAMDPAAARAALELAARALGPKASLPW